MFENKNCWYSLIHRVFLHSVAIILWITAFGKIISAFNPSQYLTRSDEVFTFLPNLIVLLGAAGLELIVAVGVFLSGKGLRGPLMVLWLTILFISYRLALWLGNGPTYCKCLGYPFQWLGFSISEMSRLSMLILTYMFFGSVSLCLLEIFYRPKNGKAEKLMECSNKRHLILIFIIIISFVKPFHQCNAASYHVAGELEISHFRENGLQWVKKNEFEVTVVDKKYSIIMYLTNRTHYVINSYDGTNTYMLAVIPRENLAPGKKQAFPIIIDNRAFVKPSGAYSEYVWLSFASHDYLNRMTNGYLNPIWPIEDHTADLEQCYIKAIVTRFDDQLKLPNQITYIADGLFRYYDSNAKSRKVISLPFPHDSGYIKAVYKVESVLTNMTCQIPSGFSFTLHSTPLRPNAHTYPYMIIRGRVFEAHEGPYMVSIPSLQDATLNVIDTRMKGAIRYTTNNAYLEYPYVRYLVESNVWPSDAELLLARMKKENKVILSKIHELKPIKRSTLRDFLFFITILIFLMPFIYFACIRIHQKMENQNKTNE